MRNDNLLKVAELFNGIGAQHKALTRLGLPFEIVATSDIDKDSIVSYAAIHCGLTLEMVDTYDKYPSRSEMADYLLKLNVGYNFKKKTSHTIGTNSQEENQRKLKNIILRLSFQSKSVIFLLLLIFRRLIYGLTLTLAQIYRRRDFKKAYQRTAGHVQVLYGKSSGYFLLHRNIASFQTLF